ncbi:MAG: class 1 fructose-bisphosphatase [Flavobacteriales bacterium]|nr:class 1 fructose-bisphosphatase [Flavobacteriales bacterium]
MKTQKVITLTQFISEQQSRYPDASGDLTRIFHDIILAAKIVNRDVRKAGLVDILGAYGTTNVQGEEVKKLDVLANDEFISALSLGGDCAAILSEENDDIIHVENPLNGKPKYIVAMDPLDGSSNIDVNASIGTIFSIFRRKSMAWNPITMEDCLQKGINQIAAGYIIYGSSTMLVYTTGQGVNGFTLDSSIGEFCLSHPNITIPKDGKIFSINEGNFGEFPKGVQDYINYCKESDKETNRPYSARYIGSLIADFHRNLLKGGIFIYPPTQKAPNGKLRLMYECNPMSFIIEQAGGKASTGNGRIMEVVPDQLHQRVPVFIGSENMVNQAEQLYRKYSLGVSEA